MFNALSSSEPLDNFSWLPSLYFEDRAVSASSYWLRTTTVPPIDTSSEEANLLTG